MHALYLGTRLPGPRVCNPTGNRVPSAAVHDLRRTPRQTQSTRVSRSRCRAAWQTMASAPELSKAWEQESALDPEPTALLPGCTARSHAANFCAMWWLLLRHLADAIVLLPAIEFARDDLPRSAAGGREVDQSEYPCNNNVPHESFSQAYVSADALR